MIERFANFISNLRAALLLILYRLFALWANDNEPVDE